MTFTSNSPIFWPLIESNSLYFKFCVASTAITIYDYGLMFRREVELIWCERWSLTTVLYFITRYLGLAIAIVQIWQVPSILLSDTECGFNKRFFSWGMVILTYTMHAIMAIRVFAMYHRSKNMRIFLIIAFMASSAARGALDGLVLSPASGSTSEEYILSGTRLCTLTKTILVPYLTGIPSVCIELIFFLLAARVFVKHVLEMRMMLPHWGFDDCLSILFKDHVLHFLCYLIGNVMQISLISINTSDDGWYGGTATLFVIIQQCVLVPRLVVSIREYRSQLSNAPDSTPMNLVTIAFANNANVESTIPCPLGS